MVSVMIAEDNEHIAECYQKYLTNDKNTKNVKIVGIANDGKKALELYNEKHPDLVLLDLGLPVLNGLEVIENITANPDDNHFSNIVVISGDTTLRLNLSNMKKVYKSISKPVSNEDLTDLVKEFDYEYHRPLFPQKKLNDLFLSLNLKMHTSSCRYLQEMVNISYFNPTLIDKLNLLYTITSKRFNCSPSKIQSSIQSSIRIVNKCSNKELRCSIFHIYEDNSKQLITTKHILECIVDYLK